MGKWYSVILESLMCLVNLGGGAVGCSIFLIRDYRTCSTSNRYGHLKAPGLKKADLS